MLRVLNKNKISGTGLRIVLFNKYLSSSHTVLGAGDAAMNKTERLPSEDLHSSW